MKEHSTFKWNDIGDLNEGRPNLGQSMPVAIYRLMQYTMKDVLINNFGFFYEPAYLIPVSVNR